MKEKYKKIIEKLNNDTIKYAICTRNSSDISSILSRYFVVIGPPEIAMKEIYKMKGEEIKGLVPYLIKAMESSDKDFAAHIMLSALTKEPMGGEEWTMKDEWHKEVKAGEYLGWRLWWEKYKDRIVWDEEWKRLKPNIVEILSEKARKEKISFPKILIREMTSFAKEKGIPIKLRGDEPKK